MSEKEVKRAALGKGFDSLLGLANEGSAVLATSEKGERLGTVMKLGVDVIEPNPMQPRKIFHDEDLQSLSASVKVDGVIQPIIVSRAEKPGTYVLVAGERRWRASKMAGLTSIPAIVKDGQPDTLLRMALIENIQRSDLSIIEEAEAYHSLISDFGLSQEQCAQKVGKDRSTVANALRLLALPREIQDDLLERRLTMGHGRALVSLEDKRLILRARDIVVGKKLSVRQTEQLCKKIKKGQGSNSSGAESVETTDADLEYLADSLRGHLRTKVKISGNSSRGRIEVSFFSAAELERLIGLMGIPSGN